MKKVLLIALCVCFSFLCVACETQTQVRSAYVTDATTPLSTKHSVRVILEKDERVDEQYVDVQIKSSNENKIIYYCNFPNCCICM